MGKGRDRKGAKLRGPELGAGNARPNGKSHIPEHEQTLRSAVRDAINGPHRDDFAAYLRMRPVTVFRAASGVAPLGEEKLALFAAAVAHFRAEGKMG